ncbi:MAG: hypothetical protein DHS20C08_13160 [Rhodomicrobium sp.]|nr:MAG: hypothetical protein DHS20C08_13160 [Rhodomicrobium sp.]
MGISLNAMLLQGGRVAYFEPGGEANNVIVQLDKRHKQKSLEQEILHVSSVPKSDDLDNKIRDVLSEAEIESADADTGRKLVMEVQVRLSELGYNPGSHDGIAGPTTLAAVMAFEFDKGLPQTGIVDREILAVLNAKKDAPSRNEASKALARQGPELVTALQSALTSLGYNTGKADGVIGPLTRMRIRAFERDNKMDVTGRISGRLILKIIKARGKPLLLAKL